MNIAKSLIYNILEERKATRGYVSNITNEVKEDIFSKGKCLPSLQE